jgi:acyl-CoA reductase-like NAD-dependent aldehyde dehydrogenase
MKIAMDEIFGPVQVILKYKTLAEVAAPACRFLRALGSKLQQATHIVRASALQ